MSAELPSTQLQLRSTVREDATLELALAELPLPEPGPEDVLVRVEAAPVNPSDLIVLLGPADPATAEASGTPERLVLTLQIPQALMPSVAGRVGQPVGCGLEGAGVVVKAGSGAAAQALVGRTVALMGGPTYTQYLVAAAGACLPLPAGTAPRDAAACFVNPLTALGMLETLRLEGHTALVHTAAASNLGQMLVKLCRADGVPLVNVVRSDAQVELLRGLGAEHVLDSSAEGFDAALIEALVKTGATLAFDAVGGGSLASRILNAMEAALLRRQSDVGRYGSATHKQVYLYGRLDPGPTPLEHRAGMAWGVGGWILPNFLARVGPETAQRMRERVARDLKSVFASSYTAEISLAQALRVETLRAYAARTTGGKVLIAPNA